MPPRVYGFAIYLNSFSESQRRGWSDQQWRQHLSSNLVRRVHPTCKLPPNPVSPICLQDKYPRNRPDLALSPGWRQGNPLGTASSPMAARSTGFKATDMRLRMSNILPSWPWEWAKPCSAALRYQISACAVSARDVNLSASLSCAAGSPASAAILICSSDGAGVCAKTQVAAKVIAKNRSFAPSTMRQARYSGQ